MKIVLITGPSGVGKDSLLGFARHYFKGNKNIVFAQRYITRPPDNNEQNYYIDLPAFALLRDNDFFISHWLAHGNCYGIAHTEFTPQSEGSLAIVSISRQVVADFENHFDQVFTFGMTVNNHILKQRLQARGREDAAAIEKRLARASLPVLARKMIPFDNSKELSVSGKHFTELLTLLMEEG